MYFAINHDHGEEYSNDQLEIVVRIIENWVQAGTDPDDISLYEGKRKDFEIKTVKRVIVKARP